MTLAASDFAFTTGIAEDLIEFTREDGEAREIPTSAGPRGLVLKRFTLNRSYEGPLARMLHHRYEQICFVVSGVDLSGEPPYSFPVDAASAETAWIEVRPHEAFEFSLGQGLPIFPARPLVGGLVAMVLVAESDHGARKFGEVLSEISAGLERDKPVLEFLASLANPAKLTVDVVRAGAGAILAVTSAILERNGNDHVGLFRGYFEAQGSWDDQLQQEQRGATVELGEVTG